MSYYQIDLELLALINNVQMVRQFAPKQKLLAVIKGNAYGHGLSICAKILQNHVDAFAVSDLAEALILRKDNINTRIVSLAGFTTESELKLAQELQCEVLLYNHEQLNIIENVHLEGSVRVWLKINTGLNRLGFKAEDLAFVIEKIHALKKIKKPLHYLTHFANADNFSHEGNYQQIQLFTQLTKTFDGEKSVCNSAGILAFPEAHLDWIRPGIILYGASPFKHTLANEYQLKPVMNVYSRLMAINILKKGDRVGYGSTWECPEEHFPIGIVPVGYADGYPRDARSGTPLSIGSRICPLVGRVSMNMLAIDLRNAPQAKLGTPVVLWGKDLPVETVAHYLETIPHDLVASIKQNNSNFFIKN